jgi:hypothetical protein
LCYLEVEERAILLGVIEVQLVEATDTREQHAVIKLLHVAARLEHHGRVCGFIFFGRQRLGWCDNALGQVIELDDGPSLLAANLGSLELAQTGSSRG